MIRLFLFFCLLFLPFLSSAGTIGLHNIQHFGMQSLLQRERDHTTTVPIIGLIFEKYENEEEKYLTQVVSKLGTGRIYHISLSPFGYTAKEVKDGLYDTAYQEFFNDIKRLDIKVIFRTMHEMNGGRYSRASQPGTFQLAWRHVWKIARQTYNLQSDRLLFSLSFNSQDLPTNDVRPTQDSPIRFCSQREIDHHGRCPRKADYYPGDKYVDLIGVTLYNRGRSRPDKRSKRKTPSQLLAEDNLLDTLSQWEKPLIIDELGTTAINFTGKRSAAKVQKAFTLNIKSKNTRLRERQTIIDENPMIKAILYFNSDLTEGMSKQVVGQADWSFVLSPYHAEYEQGVSLLTQNNSVRSIERLFRLKKK